MNISQRVWRLRSETLELRIETCRWCGLSRDEQTCKNCDEGEVEDIEHFLRVVCEWLRRGWRWRG